MPPVSSTGWDLENRSNEYFYRHLRGKEHITLLRSFTVPLKLSLFGEISQKPNFREKLVASLSGDHLNLARMPFCGARRSIHPSGPPSPPRPILHKMLTLIQEFELTALKKAPPHPGNRGLNSQHAPLAPLSWLCSPQA
jgi:hypothetical protein